MNPATKLLLLSAILLLLAVVVSKLQAPSRMPADQTASLRDHPASTGAATIPSRLSGQPQIVRAKQESGLDPSPSPWHLEDGGTSAESAAPMSVPVFPTGQPLVPSTWLNEGSVPGSNGFDAGDPPGGTALQPVPDSQSAVAAWPPGLEPVPVPPTGHVLTEPQDSFWRISERMYGTGKYYKALYQHNRAAVLRPDQLESGIQIATPPLDELRALYPQLCPDGAPVSAPRGT